MSWAIIARSEEFHFGDTLMLFHATLYQEGAYWLLPNLAPVPPVPPVWPPALHALQSGCHSPYPPKLAPAPLPLILPPFPAPNLAPAPLPPNLSPAPQPTQSGPYSPGPQSGPTPLPPIWPHSPAPIWHAPLHVKIISFTSRRKIPKKVMKQTRFHQLIRYLYESPMKLFSERSSEIPPSLKEVQIRTVTSPLFQIHFQTGLWWLLEFRLDVFQTKAGVFIIWRIHLSGIALADNLMVDSKEAT